MKKIAILLFMTIFYNTYSMEYGFCCFFKGPYSYLRQLGKQSILFRECKLCKKGWFKRTPKQKECNYLENKLEEIDIIGTRISNSLNKKAVDIILEGYSEDIRKQELEHLNILGNTISDRWVNQYRKE